MTAAEPADGAATSDTTDGVGGASVAKPTHPRFLLAAYVGAVFLGASLLFLVEPMVAKMLLPLLGGTPSVWNTAMVFFQGALLAGYALAHLTLVRLGPRRQSVLQILLLALPCLLLPIGVPAGWRPPAGGSPALWTLLVLAVMVGGPFVMLSTAGPTLQRWFSATDHPHAADPYFLYAAGNVGSLLALLAYPLILEPTLSLDTQSRLWAGGYVGFVVLSALCAVLVRVHGSGVTVARLRRPANTPSTSRPTDDRMTTDDTMTTDDSVTVADRSPVISRQTRLRWIGLATIPSALMLGLTHHIATDIASMPLLWVLPLSLYLVTFIVAFGHNPEAPIRVSARLLKLLVVPLVLSFMGLVSSIWFELPLHLAVFFCAAMVAHGRLASERPDPGRLTEFYLLLSVGGVAGGILTALVAPEVFPTVIEYPLFIVLALTVLPAGIFAGPRVPAGPDAGEQTAGPQRAVRFAHRPLSAAAVASGSLVIVLAIAAVAIRSNGSQQALTLSILVAAVAAGGAFALARTPLSFAGAIGVVLTVAMLVPANPTTYSERTFFGVHRVYEDKTAAGRHVLLNGRTVHGMENVAGPHAGEPETYYHRTGPIGQWMESWNSEARPHHVGLIGLGSGALAWYGRPGDRYTYYEIDPAVVGIATNPALFTFVPHSKAEVDFVVGDGRLELESNRDARYDLLVADAFSSDAIPLHLITREAIELYSSRLTEHGVIAFHISNRYFDFAPVLARLATDLNLTGMVKTGAANPEEQAAGKLDATWVLLARAPGDLAPVAGDPGWQPLGDGAGAPLWTDQYSDLLHVFRLS